MKFTIRRLASFELLFNRLSRKAVKLGLPAPSFVVTGERTELADIYTIFEGECKKSGEAIVVVNDIEISGLDPVRFEGWDFIARIETIADQNIIYSVPNVEPPAKYIASGSTCDHCKAIRQRNHTFLVRQHETGEYMQVGSTCLADFVGGNSAERVAALFAFYGSVIHDLDGLRDSEIKGWEGGNAAHDLRDVVARSIQIQAEHGWLSRSKAYDNGGTSTAARELSADKSEYSPTKDTYDKADLAIAHFASLTEGEMSDTLTRNAHIICNAGFCSNKSHGLACALWVCYNVAIMKVEREAQRERQRVTSKHFGEIGKRIKNIEGTVLSVFSYDTAFGVQTKTILEDHDGNVLVAKALGDGNGDAKVGDRVRFTATIKGHDLYNDVKQTSLLRAANVVFV